jgi:hypothetical protein
MVYHKYTRALLEEAVAASVTMSGVLRHLGLRQNGGTQAHLRRRINGFGIDTSHFLGQAHSRGRPSTRRLAPEKVLVVRPEGATRQKPATLKRALLSLGRQYRCEGCGVGSTWNGKPLTLQIDHIDGHFLDCRVENLRFLCPNCHSQTPTHAGRNKVRASPSFGRIDLDGRTVEEVQPLSDITKAQKIELLELTRRGELTVSDAARLLGCSPNYIYILRRKLLEGRAAEEARTTQGASGSVKSRPTV